MGRRTSSGRIGAPTFGGLLADAQTIKSDDNKDIIFDPTGTGIVKSEGHFQIQNQNSLRFGDADDSNYVALQAPTTISSNVVWTLPDSDGSANQALVTDGNGNLSFVTTAASIEDNNLDSGQNNILLTTQSSGNLTQARVSSSALTFQPSTGILSVTELTVNGTARNLALENVQTSSYVVALSDQNKVVTMNNSAGASITIPNSSTVNFPIGSEIQVYRLGSGSLLVTEAAGVTLTRSGGQTGNAYMERYEQITLRKRDTNTWVVYTDSEGVLSTTGGDVRNVSTNTEYAYFTSGSSTFTVTAQ